MTKLAHPATALVLALTALLSNACTTHNGGGTDAGTSSGNTGGGTGSGSSGSSGSTSCALPVGSYVIQYTLVSGPGCSQLQNTTFTISAGQTSMTTDPGCITSNDNASCMTTTTCNSSSNGYTTESDSVATISGSAASGTLHETESTGGTVVLDCTYDFFVTKQ